MTSRDRNGPDNRAESAPNATTTNGHHAGRAYCDPNAGIGRTRFTRDYYRSPKWDCGCHVPCRCEFHDNPTPARVDGYKAALEHLSEHGLTGAALIPECRQLWRRGGADRQLADDTVRWWSA